MTMVTTVKRVEWFGDITVTNDWISYTDYEKYFDSRYISYHALAILLKEGRGTKFAVPADLLKKEYTDRIKNEMMFGYSFRKDQSRLMISSSIHCYCNGNEVDYKSLPILARVSIAKDILNDSKRYGICYC